MKLLTFFKLTKLFSLKHQNLPKNFQHFEQNDETVISMDYYSSTLRKSIKKPLPVQTVKNYAKELISVFSYLHQNKQFHGNVSPDSILVQKFSSHSSLIIYGYDILKSDVEKDENTIYKPKKENISEKFDVFSIGVLIYQLLTNKMNPIHEHLEKDENFMKKILAKKDVQLVDFIFQSTKLNTKERASIDDLKRIFEKDNDLESILKSKKINFEKLEESMKKKKGFISDRYLNPKTFEGQEFVDYIIKEHNFTIEESLNLGDLMISKNLIRSIQPHNFRNDGSIYRFISQENGIDMNLEKKDSNNDNHKLPFYFLGDFEKSNLLEKIEKEKGILIAVCSEEQDKCEIGMKSWNVNVQTISDPECILAQRYHMLTSKPNFLVSKFHKKGLISESGSIVLKQNEIDTKEDKEIKWFDFEQQQEILYHHTDPDYKIRVDLIDIFEKIVFKKLNNEMIENSKVKSTGNLILKGISFLNKKK
eukprot:gene2696-3892_t